MTPGFPLIDIGGPNDGIPSEFSGLGLGTTSMGPQTNPLSTFGSKVSKAASSIGKAASSAYSGMSSNDFISSLFGLQAITGVVGLLLITAGIFLFRPVRETIISAGKTAGKAAAIAAA